MKWRESKDGRDTLNISHTNKKKKKQTVKENESAPSVLVFYPLSPDGLELCVTHAYTLQIMQAIRLSLCLCAPNLHPVSGCQWPRRSSGVTLKRP